MLPALASVAFAAGIAGLVGLAGSSIAPSLWRGREHVGVAIGIISVGLAAVVAFLAAWIHPVVGTAVSLLVVLGAAAVVVHRRTSIRWRGLSLPAGLVAGVALIDVGLLYLWQTDLGTFSLAAERFIPGLPVDNLIPQLFADRLGHGLGTHTLIGDWNGSDRPPLEAGFILLTGGGVDALPGVGTRAFGASVAAQLLWVPAVFAFCRALGGSRRAATLGTLFAAALSSTLVNTVYTWPKLMSAALVIASAALLLDAVRRPAGFARQFPLAVVAFMLGALAHGAAAFAAPLVIALGVWAYRRHTFGAVVRATAIGAGVGILVYAPWSAYQLVADPPGDRLAKWHLAGAFAIDDRSTLTTIVESYRTLTPEQWVQGRLVNLTAAFDPRLLAGVGDVMARRSAEFYVTSVALGLAVPVLALAVTWAVVRLVRGRGTRFDRGMLVVVAGSVVSIVVWCILIFIPGSTAVHHGSHVWLLILAAAPLAWLAHRTPRAAIGVVGVQAVATLLVVAPGEPGARPDVLAFTGALVGVALVLACVPLSANPRLAIRRTPR